MDQLDMMQLVFNALNSLHAMVRSRVVTSPLQPLALLRLAGCVSHDGAAAGPRNRRQLISPQRCLP